MISPAAPTNKAGSCNADTLESSEPSASASASASSSTATSSLPSNQVTQRGSGDGSFGSAVIDADPVASSTIYGSGSGSIVGGTRIRRNFGVVIDKNNIDDRSTVPHEHDDDDDDYDDGIDSNNADGNNDKKNRKNGLFDNLILFLRKICGIQLNRRDIENHVWIQWTQRTLATILSVIVPTYRKCISSRLYKYTMGPIAAFIFTDRTIGNVITAVAQAVNRRMSTSMTHLTPSATSSHHHHNHLIHHNPIYRRLVVLLNRFIRSLVKVKISTLISVLCLTQFLLYCVNVYYFHTHHVNPHQHNAIGLSLHHFKYGLHDSSYMRMLERAKHQRRYNLHDGSASATATASLSNFLFNVERPSPTPTSAAVLNPADRKAIRMAILQLKELKQNIKSEKRIDSTNVEDDPYFGMPYLWSESFRKINCTNYFNSINNDPFPLSFDLTNYARHFETKNTTGTKTATQLMLLYQRQKMVFDHLKTKFFNISNNTYINSQIAASSYIASEIKRTLFVQQSYWLFGRYLGLPVSTGQRMRKIINTNIIPYISVGKVLEIDPGNNPITEPFLLPSLAKVVSHAILPALIDRHLSTKRKKTDLFAFRKNNGQQRRRLTEVKAGAENSDEEDDQDDEKKTKKTENSRKEKSVSERLNKKRNPRIEYMDLVGEIVYGEDEDDNDEDDVAYDDDDLTCSAMATVGVDDDEENEEEDKEVHDGEEGDPSEAVKNKKTRRQRCNERRRQTDNDEKDHDTKHNGSGSSRKYHNLVPFDYIEPSGNISSIIEKNERIRDSYSIIVCSNRIQQKLDFIDYFQSISNLLMDGGYYVMEVPDKRYNGECFIPETTLAIVLEHFYASGSSSSSSSRSSPRKKMHSPKTILEAMFMTMPENRDEIWTGNIGPKPTTLLADDTEIIKLDREPRNVGEVVVSDSTFQSLFDMKKRSKSTKQQGGIKTQYQSLMNHEDNKVSDKGEFLERIRNAMIEYETSMTTRAGDDRHYRRRKWWRRFVEYNNYHFTPTGMAFIIDSLYRLHYIDVYVHRLYETLKNEASFTIVLKRCAQTLKPKPRKHAGMLLSS